MNINYTGQIGIRATISIFAQKHPWHLLSIILADVKLSACYGNETQIKQVNNDLIQNVELYHQQVDLLKGDEQLSINKSGP